MKQKIIFHDPFTLDSYDKIKKKYKENIHYRKKACIPTNFPSQNNFVWTMYCPYILQCHLQKHASLSPHI
jgi:hypothetical protein